MSETQNAMTAATDQVKALTAGVQEFDPQPYIEMAGVYGVQLLTAVIIFVAGKWVAKRVTNVLKKTMNKGNVDATLVKFLGNIAYGLMLAFVCIAALSQVGIETASLAAIIAAAGLAIGLALQGSLSNFAAGVMLILFRPFKAGDFIEAAGLSGVVAEVSIFTTVLTTGDNKKVIVPNSAISSGSITNYSAHDTRRLDLVIGVGYNDDIAKVKKTLEKILKDEKRVLKDPAAVIAVLELADSSVNFAVRPWVKTADYWGTYFDLMETIKVTFDKEGISIPFPQRDVHVIDAAAAKKLAA
jgi:small conductance mechanosensitive channel